LQKRLLTNPLRFGKLFFVIKKRVLEN
jgi:hypothetical protein